MLFPCRPKVQPKSSIPNYEEKKVTEASTTTKNSNILLLFKVVRDPYHSVSEQRLGNWLETEKGLQLHSTNLRCNKH